MLRITEYIRDSLMGNPVRPNRGVILIWNLTHRCNLRCRHCYSSASPRPGPELSLAECLALIPVLRAIGVRFAILSGGEPLTHKHLYEIVAGLKSAGIRTYLSTNGLLIDEKSVGRIAAEFDYVGISLDGTPEVHDRFRGKRGAFQRSLRAVELCLERDIRLGVRFTITPMTRESLPFLFRLAEELQVPKVYVSHLVYSGRGQALSALSPQDERNATEYILDRAFQYVEEGRAIDVVTGNNEADAVLLLRRFAQRHPSQAHRLEDRLVRWGGNQAGVRMLNINSRGEVRPDPFFAHSVGNVRDDPLDELWRSSPLLRRLRHRSQELQGPCRNCPHLAICNGNSRARSQATTGDYFSSDPACYLLPLPGSSQERRCGTR
ncbi:MAG: radical SAM protein [Armatimonadetes bacterium]|nr:radical SAM protein [Armatimonadota bacterium]